MNDPMEATLAEFGPSLAHLGLTRPQLAQLISQAMEAGATDPDQPAGALREFWLRTRDGSANTRRALGTLGLDPLDVAERVAAAGSEQAREALGDVLDALRDLGYGHERHQVAVNLFGVAAEDLGDALFAMEVQ